MNDVFLFFLRLVVAPVLLVFFLVTLVLLTLYCSVGWIFTGAAQLRISWPDWS